MGITKRHIEDLKSIICDIENENQKIYHVIERQFDLIEVIKEYIIRFEMEVKKDENI